MSIKSKLISNSMYLFLFRFFNILFITLFWLILAKTLSKASYGIVAVSLQIMTLLSSLSMVGLGMTTNKLIPELVKKNEKNKLQGLIFLSLKVTLLLSIVLSLVFVAFSMTASHILNLRPNTLWSIVFSTIFMALAIMLGNIYYGFQNMRKLFLTGFFGYLLMVILTLSFIPLHMDYLGPLIAFLLSFVLIFVIRVEKRFFTVSKNPVIDRRRIFKYAMPAFIVILFAVIFNNTQFIILSAMETAEIVGMFAVAMKIASVLSVIPAVLSRGLFPIISELSVDAKSKSKQSYLVSLVFRYGIFIILPTACFMLIFSKYLILFFATAEYLPATNLLPILVIGGVFLGLANQFLSSLYAIGEPKKYRDSYVISTLVYLILAGILTYYFSAKGLAFAYLISSFALLLATFVFIKRSLTLKLPLKDMGKMLISLCISFLFLIIMVPHIPNFWVAIPFVLVAAFIYLAVLLKLDFYIKEDLKILDFLAERTPIFKGAIIMFRKFLSKFVKN